jgi:molybdenum cofactor synthesis domain-containing protein
MNHSAAVLTVSDSTAHGQRQDLSGPAVRALLEQHGFQVIATEVVADDRIAIENALIRLSDKASFVASTGGTGLAERDVTPEATQSIADRLVPGISEHIRAEGVRKTPLAVLSRGVCGIRNTTLILNLPGSPKGATESLASVIELIPHCLDLLAGKTAHPPQP